MKKFMAMLMATALCVATLSACGNNAADNAGTSAASTESTATESTETETTTEGTEATEATDGQVFTVGTNAEFPPFEYVGDDGEPDGFDVALIKAVVE